MGKRKNGVPDGWLDYLPVGLVIAGTKIVAFKVPLRMNWCQRHLSEDEWFTPSMLLEKLPKLRTVIDLTNTFRYYDGQEEFGTKGIDHVKILVEGRGILPTVSQLQKFFDAMDGHMEKYRDNNEALIGVHCTHGLNRTGYFVCRWMLERMGINPDDAIERFNLARGHPIERQHLLNDLRGKNHRPVPRTLNAVAPSSITHEYRSPLDDYTYEEPSRDSRYGRYRGRGGGRARDKNDSYHSERDVSNQRKPSQRNVNHNRYGISKRQNSRGAGPSRADLDTNWRARDPDESKREKDQNNFHNFESSRSDRRLERSKNRRSPRKRN